MVYFGECRSLLAGDPGRPVHANHRLQGRSFKTYHDTHPEVVRGTVPSLAPTSATGPRYRPGEKSPRNCTGVGPSTTASPLDPMKIFRLRFLLLFGGCSLGVVALALFAAAPPPAATPGFDPVSRAELGRLLFWDPLLSGGKDVACATCHHPDFAYADGRALALGARATGLGPGRVDVSRGEIPVVKRNTPTILNVVFNGLDRRGRGGLGR